MDKAEKELMRQAVGHMTDTHDWIVEEFKSRRRREEAEMGEWLELSRFNDEHREMVEAIMFLKERCDRPDFKNLGDFARREILRRGMALTFCTNYAYDCFCDPCLLAGQGRLGNEMALAALEGTNPFEHVVSRVGCFKYSDVLERIISAISQRSKP